MIPLFTSVSVDVEGFYNKYIEDIPVLIDDDPNDYVAITVTEDNMEDKIKKDSIIVLKKILLYLINRLEFLK